MMCARLLRAGTRARRTAGSTQASERASSGCCALRAIAALGAAASARHAGGDARDDGRDGLPLREIPKGFFPQQDTGSLSGSIQADQDMSFQAMQRRVAQFVDIVMRDPAVGHRPGVRRRRRHAEHRADVRHPQAARRAPRSRRRGHRAAARKAGGRAGRDAVPAGGAGSADRRPASNAQYQFTLQGESVKELNDWAPQRAQQAAEAAAAGRREQRSAEPRAGGVAGDRSRHRRRGSASRRRRSTTRSTTPSASGRSRRCTRS